MRMPATRVDSGGGVCGGGLDRGVHTVRIEWAGVNPAAAPGALLIVDAIEVDGG